MSKYYFYLRDWLTVMPSLFYVIGASGAGKDSLMLAARQALDGEAIAFAHRYITRSAEAGGENFIGLTLAEFAQRDKKGAFYFSWTSHDLHYGVGSEVLSWLQGGLTVVVNGSRAYLPQAQEKCTALNIKLVPIWVVCDLPALAARLRARGRESEAQIEERLRRAAQFLPPEDARVINNSGTLEQSLAQWLPLLKQALR